MKYIVIGLGNYGHVLTEELPALGHEVIGADSDEGWVNSIKGKIATAFIIDVTDEQSLPVLPLSSTGMVIVAVDKNFGVSIHVVAMLEQKQVQHIYACAIDGIYKVVLEALGLEKVLTPEEGATRGLTQLLDLGTEVETFRTDSEYYAVEFNAPERFVGYFISELNLDEEFRLKLIGLKRFNTIKNYLGISLAEHKIINELPESTKIRPDDVLVCYGEYNNFQKLWKTLW